MKIEEWKQRNLRAKYYAHFDKRLSVDHAWGYISNPDKVARHGFFPFIHYVQSFRKYNTKTGVKDKKRELCYASHMDRYIYSYYGYMLNEKYNERVRKDGISDSAVAYRTDLGENNIHFAKKTFQFIRENKDCHIIVGDFTHFFDKLDHRYLKRQMCSLLACESLPADYYAVFKNITRYATWDLKSLLQINRLKDTKKGIKALNRKETVLTGEQFKQNKKACVVSHKESFGIPQGSPISAVLSNIYMLEFDNAMRRFTEQHSGLYMRYSDDFIVVIPDYPEQQFADNLKWIQEIVLKTEGLELQEEKTQVYQYSNGELSNISVEYLSGVKDGSDLLNYLGFTFDGKLVTIRDKTLSKYHYRMYRKADYIVKCGGRTKNGRRISNKELYRLYSKKGARSGKGNFITYVQNAERIFTDDPIARGTSNHMQKIRARLKMMPPF